MYTNIHVFKRIKLYQKMILFIIILFTQHMCIIDTLKVRISIGFSKTLKLGPTTGAEKKGGALGRPVN